MICHVDCQSVMPRSCEPKQDQISTEKNIEAALSKKWILYCSLCLSFLTVDFNRKVLRFFTSPSTKKWCRLYNPSRFLWFLNSERFSYVRFHWNFFFWVITILSVNVLNRILSSFQEVTTLIYFTQIKQICQYLPLTQLSLDN